MTEKCKRCGRKTTSVDGVCGNRSSAKCAELAAKRDDVAADGMLDRMGWGALAKKPKTDEPAGDSPPPATKKARAKPSPKPPPDWVSRFRALAGALGLKPEEMIEDYCRGWVEHVQRKALSADLKQLPSGEGEAAA